MKCSEDEASLYGARLATLRTSLKEMSGLLEFKSLISPILMHLTRFASTKLSHLTL